MKIKIQVVPKLVKENIEKNPKVEHPLATKPAITRKIFTNRM
jgi:hypothetical protein